MVQNTRFMEATWHHTECWGLIFFDWDTDGLPDHVGIVECVKDEADLLHVSRQNVNQIKKRAERKLRKRLS